MAVTLDPNVGVIITDYSANVTTTAVLAIGPEVLEDNTRLLAIYNNSASGTLWASHTGTAAVGALQSFSIGPASSKIYAAPGPIPLNQLSLISSTGTIATTIQVGAHSDGA